MSILAKTLMLLLSRTSFSLCLIFFNWVVSSAQKWSFQNDTLNEQERQVVLQIYSVEKCIEKSPTDTTCFQYLKPALRNAYYLNFYKAIAAIYNVKGSVYFQRSDWEYAINCFEMSIKAAHFINAKSERCEMIMHSLVDLAEVYNYNGDYVTALEYRMKALQYEDSLNVSASQRLNLYVSIANDFRHLNQQSKAIEYLKVAEPYFEGADGNHKLNYLYEYYQNQLKFGALDAADSLLEKFDEGLHKFELNETQFLEFKGMSHKLHGQYELNYTKQYDKALFHYRQYLHCYEQLENKVHISIAYNKIGLVYVAMGKDMQAIQVLDSAFKICVEEKNLDYAFETALTMSEAYNRLGMHNQAYHFSIQAFRLKDSLTAAEKLRELNLYEARFQSTKKENKITELELLNTKEELNVLLQKRQKTLISISAAALLLILVFLYIQSRNKNILASKEKALQVEQIESLKQKQQVVALQNVLKIQDQERARIARDLHDSIGGLFSTIKMYVSTLGEKYTELSKDELFRKSITMVDKANTEVRNIAHNMMPDVLVRMGLINALQDLCSSINVNNKLNVQFIHTGNYQLRGGLMEPELYKIVQELLNNAIRHSGADNLIVQLVIHDDSLNLTVEDNGVGFDYDVEMQKNKAGMQIIKSRVETLGGKIHIDSEKNKGTTIMVELNFER